MTMRQVTVISQEVLSEGGRELAAPTMRVAACGVLHNPFAGKPPIDDFAELVEISLKAGELLTARALAALAPLKPRGYGKAALVGAAGDLEHGASMIHVRIGLAIAAGRRRWTCAHSWQRQSWRARKSDRHHLRRDRGWLGLRCHGHDDCLDRRCAEVG